MSSNEEKGSVASSMAGKTWLPQDVMDPDQFAQLSMELAELQRKLKAKKRELWLDQVSLRLRRVVEPYEMKPVLLIVGTFLGLFLGLLLSLTIIGFWLGLLLGVLLACCLGAFFVRTLYWKDTESVRRICQLGPADVANLQKKKAEKNRDFEAAFAAAVQRKDQEEQKDQRQLANRQSLSSHHSGQGAKKVPKNEKASNRKLENIRKGTKVSGNGSSGSLSCDLDSSGVPSTQRWRTCSPAEFRVLVEGTFRNLGYKLQIPQNDSQLGVHLIAYHSAQRIVVKVVPEPIQVTQGAVQQVFSAKIHLECDSSLVITPGTFSIDARKLAKSTKAILIGQIEMNKFLEGRVFPRIMT